MKTILNKFHLNITTYLFFLLAFFCGYFKQTILIFSLVFFHECGHILAIKICHYKFLKVEFYPFGGITKIDKPLNSSINKEIFISVSGVLVQIILGILASFFSSSFSFFSYTMFWRYNLILLLFNMLPILPLDGSILLHSLLEKMMSYKNALCVYQIISCIVLFSFFLFNIYMSLDNYFICVILLGQFIKFKKQEKYLLYRFYLERYLHTYPYKKIRNEPFSKTISSLRKEVLHFYFDEENQKYLHEKAVLKKFFYKTNVKQ